MQMLQQFFGEQGARYATWVLTVIVLLILVLVVWNLLKRALGDRLNMGDRPDRRGRPPRLGITESFTVDRQGRRLVMVRRDNVEHLVMIGGPNDFVVETSIVRGERPAVARTENRQSDSELVPALTLSSPDPAPIAASAPVTPLPPAAAPVARAPYEAPKPAPYVQPQPVATKPAVEAPVSVVSPAPAIAEKVAEAAQAMKAPEVAKPTMSLADRFRAALPIGGTKPEVATAVEAAKPAPAKAEVVKAETMKPEPAKSDPPKVDVSKVDVPKVDVPKIDLPKPETAKSDLARAEAALDAQAAAKDRMNAAAEATKARMDDALQAVVPKPVAPPPPVVAPAPVAVVPPPPVPSAPVAPPIVAAVAPVVPPAATPAPPPPAPPGAQPPATASKPVSKNPFDSLEEEMAKLLGRAPDGKG